MSVRRNCLWSALACTLLAAGPSAAQSPPSAAPPIKIGVLTPFTGPFAAIGADVKHALELSAKEINAAGGILGRPIALVYEDSEGNPAVGTQRAEKLLLSDKVDFLTGTVHSGVTLAVGQLAERNDRLLVTTVSTSNAITGDKCSPNVLRVNPSSGMQAAALALWTEQFKKGARILYVGPDYEMGRSAVSEFKRAAEALGAQSAGEVYVPLGAKDFSQYFGQIRAAKADILYTSTAGTDSSRLITQLKEYGIGGFALIGSTSAVTTENLGAIGSAAEGFVTGSGYAVDVDTPANKEFVAKFKAVSGHDPNHYAADTYSVLPFLKAAAEKAGGLDTAKLREAMRGLSWDTPQGRKTMRAGDHQAVIDMHALKLAGTTFKSLVRIGGEKAVGPDTCTRW